MKKYKVIANGTEYEVLIELVSDDAQAPAAAKPAEPAKPAAPAAPAAPKAAAGEGAIKAPLTGTVTTINVKPGDQIQKGKVLMILEAMKMENEILAPSDGTVKSVFISAGTQVEAGTPLCEIG